MLVNDQKKKFIDICSRSYDEFLELTDILFMEFLQIAAKNPSPNNTFLNLDIEIVHNQLVYMRSNDIWLGFPFDVFTIVALKGAQPPKSLTTKFGSILE